MRAGEHALLVVDVDRYNENLQIMRADGSLKAFYELNRRGYDEKYGCDDFDKKWIG